MKVYKVLTQRDHWFKGSFSPEKLEEAMNHYAEKGWRVVAVTTTLVGKGLAWLADTTGAERQEVVVFMEMEVASKEEYRQILKAQAEAEAEAARLARETIAHQTTETAACYFCKNKALAHINAMADGTERYEPPKGWSVDAKGHLSCPAHRQS